MNEDKGAGMMDRLVDSHWECEACGHRRFRLVQRTDRGEIVAKRVDGQLDLVEEIEVKDEA
jgi:DNA-directed RNA polymerase subunit RPC12/RpoP